MPQRSIHIVVKSEMSMSLFIKHAPLRAVNSHVITSLSALPFYLLLAVPSLSLTHSYATFTGLLSYKLLPEQDGCTQST